MANIYAVATGVWDTTNTSIWSATDGGAPGASAPTSSDKVLLTAASGAITVTLGANVSCLECIQTGFTGTLDWAGNKIIVNGVSWVGSATCTNTGTPVVEVAYAGSSSVTIAGSSLAEANAVSFNVTAATGALTVSGGVKNLNLTGFTGSLVNSARAIYGSPTFSSTATYTAGTNVTTFAATSGTQVITSNGVTLDFPVTFNGVGGTFKMIDALTLGSTRTATFTNGTLDLNSQTLTCAIFSSANSNTRVLAFGTGKITTANSGATIINMTGSGFTFTGTSLIECTYSGGTGTRTITMTGFSVAGSLNLSITAGTDIVALTTAATLRNLIFTGFSGTHTLVATTLVGNLTFSTGMTVTGAAVTHTYAATSGTQAITSNGKSYDCSITLNGVGGTMQLAGALTATSARTFTLTNGALDLQTFTLTFGLVNLSTTNTRSVTFGSGAKIVVTGSGGSVFGAGTATGLTITGTSRVELTYSGSTGTRTVVNGTTGGSAATAFNIYIMAGTDVLAIATGGFMRTLDFTGFAGTHTLVAQTFYGNVTFSTGMTVTGAGVVHTYAATSGTQTITSNGKTYGCSITQNGVGGTVALADALTLTASSGGYTLTNGTLDLSTFTATIGTFSSSNSNTRSITLGVGAKFVVNGSGATIWGVNTATNLTISGTLRVECTYSGAVGTRIVNQGAVAGGTAANAPDVYVTAGTDTFTTQNGTTAGTLDFTGFAGTFTNQTRNLSGSLVISTGMTVSAGTNVTTFAATSGTKGITCNGVALDFPIIVSATGATVQLADALTMAASRALTLTGGTFDANNKNVTVGNFTAGAGATTRVTSMGSGTWTILDAGATAWNTPAAASHTLTPGASTVLMTAATAKTFVGGGRTFWNLSNGGAGALTITGANTFNDLQNTVTPATFTLPASTTTTVSALSLQGTSGNLVTLNSSTAATRATLSKASGTVDVSYLSIKDSAATGGASFFAQTGNGNIDAGNNTGWSFATRTAVTGVGAAGSVGDASVTAGASASPAGVSATGSVEAVAVSILVALVVAGLQAVGGVGTADETAGSNVYVSGAEAFGVAGDASVTARASTSPTGVPATGSVGTAAVALPRTVSVTGLRAVGSIGTVAAAAVSNVYVSGIQALGLIAQTLVWGVIDTAETANWQPVNDAQTSNWSLVDDGNTVTWVEIPT